MKKNVFTATGITAILLIATWGGLSCVNKEESQDPKPPSLSLEQIFEKAIEKSAEKTDLDEEVIEINLKWDSKNQSGIIEKINAREFTIEDDWPNYLGYDNISARTSKADYTVECSVNCSGCSGSGGAGAVAKMGKKCLKNGGCATVCNAHMTYYPKDRLFILTQGDSLSRK